MRNSIAVSKSIVFIVVFLGIILPASGQYTDDAMMLTRMARDLWAPVDLNAIIDNTPALPPKEALKRIRQATVFLEAALAMDASNKTAWNDIFLLLTSESVNDPERGWDALIQYSTLQPEDNTPVESWISYNLDHLDTRLDREEFLYAKMVPALGDYPLVLADVCKRLGVFALEKSLVDSLPQQPDAGEPQKLTIGARQFYSEAIQLDPSNDDALGRLLLLPDPLIDPTLVGKARLEAEKQLAVQRLFGTALRWRLRLSNDPGDLQAVLNLIDLLVGSGHYGIALDYYEHAIKLVTSQASEGLTPSQQVLLTNLQFAYLVSIYRDGDYEQCIAVADKVLDEHPGSLRIAAVRAMAVGQFDHQAVQADKLMREAAASAVKALPGRLEPVHLGPVKELAWFYCFIDPQLTEALEYARKAVLLSPNDSEARGCLAYAYVMNAMPDEAEKTLKGLDKTDLVVQLTRSVIYEIARKDKQAAYDTLAAINMHQAGLLVERIEKKVGQLRKDLGVTVAQNTDEALEDPLTLSFKAQFDNKDLEVAFTPESFIHCNIKFDRDNFSYGDPMVAQLNLSNTRKVPLRMGADGFVDPYLLIMADVQPIARRAARMTATGAKMQFPLSHRYLGQSRVLAPSELTTKDEPLNIGPLCDVLDQHPQQSYRITFWAILDPVPDGKGGFVGKNPAIQPRPVTVTRVGYMPAVDRMSLQYKLLRSGTAPERIKSSRVLCALLREESLAREGKLAYRSHAIRSKETLLKGVAANLSHQDFRVRAWTAYHVKSLPASMAGPLASELGKLLTDEHWFVRFMAMHTMVALTDMSDFMEWALGNEKNQINKRQIQLWLEKPWEIQRSSPEEE